jgi:hypothetical protein
MAQNNDVINYTVQVNKSRDNHQSLYTIVNAIREMALKKNGKSITISAQVRDDVG